MVDECCPDVNKFQLLKPSHPRGVGGKKDFLLQCVQLALPWTMPKKGTADFQNNGAG